MCLRISEREERQWPARGADEAAGPERRRRAARAQRRVRDSCVRAALWLRGVSVLDGGRRASVSERLALVVEGEGGARGAQAGRQSLSCVRDTQV